MRPPNDQESVDAPLPVGEDEFRLIADSAPVAVWVTRLDRHRSFVNRAYVEFVGVPYEEALDFDWRKIIHPDDAARWRKALTRALRERAPYAIVYRRQAHDGMYRDVRDEAKPRLVAERDFAGFIGRTTIVGEPVARIELAAGEAASS